MPSTACNVRRPGKASSAQVARSHFGVRAGALAVLLLAAACQPQSTPFLAEYPAIDLLVENGRVLDGLGGDAVAADVAVVGDEIVFIGEAAFSEADLGQRVRRRIDAAGRHVTPGFIDLHSHGDPFETPEFENFLAMGVTTITLGQDGSSPAVKDLGGWLDRVAASRTGTNIAMLVGHGTLRDLSGIGLQPDPPPEQLAAMLDLLDRTLPVAFGMSTGLEYQPGLNASAEELSALAEVVGRHGRVIMSHMRNEDDDQLEGSIAELLEQGRHSRVHIAHLKSVYGRGAGRAEEILAILAAARQAGIEITADVYPYTASYTGIAIVFPAWAKTDEQFAVAKRERRPELEAWLRERITQRNGPEATLLGTAPYTGKTLAEIAFEREMPYEDVLIDVIGPQGASGAYFVMNDELQARLLADPAVGISSDGSPVGFHPRGHGAFAVIVEEYVVERAVLTLPEAVRKVTSFAAEILGIPDRGVLRPGMKADLLIFDPARVRATATYPEPFRLAEGFDVVIVNGIVAREGGRLSPQRAGRVLVPRDLSARPSADPVADPSRDSSGGR